MDPTILLVATATQWLGTARMPRDLALAGWTVSLLAPKASLAENSRYVGKIGHLADQSTPHQWLHAFAAMVKASDARLVMPCDDTAFRLMQQLVVAPPGNLQPVLQLQLSALIKESLGDPAHYETSVDKTLLCQAAEALGVRVPPYIVVADLMEADDFVAAHGWPIVIKRRYSTAGDGVAICADGEALIREFARLAKGAQSDRPDTGTRRLLLQAFIPGRTHYYAATTWRGSVIGGYAVEKLEGHPHGAASVVRYYASEELADFTAKLAAGFGATGIFGPEFIIHKHTGQAYLLEINRRVTPGTHRGGFMDVGSGAALLAAMQGTPSATRAQLDDGEEHTFVSFPHEWLRDPMSDYLRRGPVDVPWDEPELIEAMLAMRHEP
jgi:glutathione synthase/RimK-type ligase-like ATP-grasp enzyme